MCLENMEKEGVLQINAAFGPYLKESGFTDYEIKKWFELFYTYTISILLIRLEQENLLEGFTNMAESIKKNSNLSSFGNDIQAREYEEILHLFKDTCNSCLQHFLRTTFTRASKTAF